MDRALDMHTERIGAPSRLSGVRVVVRCGAASPGASRPTISRKVVMSTAPGTS